MIVINIGGGPGSGKTTLAYYLTYRLKTAGIRAEFVGEAAREHIYSSAPNVVPPQLQDNQPLLAGEQYERVKRLERHGIEVAVSDSPVIMGTLYCRNPRHTDAVELTAYVAQYEFPSINVFAQRRLGSYDPESRVQRTEAEAARFDAKIRDLLSWDLTYEWGEEKSLGDFIVHEARLRLEKLRQSREPQS